MKKFILIFVIAISLGACSKSEVKNTDPIHGYWTGTATTTRYDKQPVTLSLTVKINDDGSVNMQSGSFITSSDKNGVTGSLSGSFSNNKLTIDNGQVIFFTGTLSNGEITGTFHQNAGSGSPCPCTYNDGTFFLRRDYSK
jgi:hypothetical protein